MSRPPSEMDFSREAEKILDNFLAQLSRKGSSPLIGDVSIFEPNTAPLVLYYLRKGLTLTAMGKPLSNGRPQGMQKVVWKTAWHLREMGLSVRGSLAHALPPADMLFVCNVVRQHASIAPVISKLAKDGWKLAVISKPPLPVPMRVKNPNVYYRDWSTLRDLNYWKGLYKKCRAWRRYWDDNLKDQLSGKGGPLIQKWFEQRHLQSIRSLLLAEHVMSGISPSVIVVTDAADAEVKVFTQIGQKRGIPSFCILYGLAGEHDSEWHYFSQDYVGTPDSHSAEILVGHGVPKNRVLLTGNPRYDGYHPDPQRKTDLRGTLEISPGQPLVAFLSTPPAPETVGAMESYLTNKDHQAILDAVYGVVSSNTPLTLVIKPHPEEDDKPYREKLQELGEKASCIRLVRDVASYDLINAADVVIISHSTAGLEAIYLDKPLITLNLTGRPDLYDYAESRAALAVRHPAELGPIADRLLTPSIEARELKEGRQRYIQRNPYFANGRTSAARCAEVILDLRRKRPIGSDNLVFGNGKQKEAKTWS